MTPAEAGRYHTLCKAYSSRLCPTRAQVLRAVSGKTAFEIPIHPWVREKFRELWDAAQSEDPD